MKKVFRTRLFLKTARAEKEKYGVISDNDIYNALDTWVLTCEGKTKEELNDIALRDEWFE